MVYTTTIISCYIVDMEDKVKGMLTLIEEDGDSFAKRAEMYYKRRPELISSVEEAYKAFRALADRYDLLSKELQNANHTIATVFPEQVQFAMSEDDEGPIPNIPMDSLEMAKLKVPQIPDAPNKGLKRSISKAAKEFGGKKKSLKAEVSFNNKAHEVKSGLTKEEALEEINKLQKDILALQTVKEFVKSSYETGVAKYWGLENQITEMQQRVSRLQDEFDMDTIIEDDEARRLMAEAALRSCQETLAMLQEKQDKSIREAREEYKRIDAACQRLQTLRQKYMHKRTNEQDDDVINEGDGSRRSLSNDVEELIKATKEIEARGSLDLSSLGSLTVSQLAEKIDQLVNRVIGLETAVSSQTVLVNTLRNETDDLNAQIRNLEEENENLVDDTKNLGTKVREMEGKLNKLQDLNKNVESQSSSLETSFAEARSSLGRLSEKLSGVKPDGEEVHETDHEACTPSEDKLKEEIKDREDLPVSGESGKISSASKIEEKEDVKEVDIDVPKQEEVKKVVRKSGSFWDRKPKEKVIDDHSDDCLDGEARENTEKDEDMNWQQMLLSGMEDKEKILLKEYTTILRNYKDVKKKLAEKETKEMDSQFDITLQLRELKKGIVKRDEEIQHLRQELNFPKGDKDVKEHDNSQLSRSPRDLSVKSETRNEDLDVNKEIRNIPITNEDDETKLIFIDRHPSISRVEEKLRTDIDSILDENLDFWLRFSTAFHQIQKFKTEVQDLQDEILRLEEKRKADGSFTIEMKSEARPIYKHLREIQRELTVWLNQSMTLKDELKGRFSSLCSIQEEITEALKEGVEEDEIRFSSHQAAKFQGEILSMKQENNKVREELQAGLDHIRILQVEVEKTLRKLNEEFGISSDQQENPSRPRVPLRSFLFGTKPKKQKHSIFACMHPNRRYRVLKAGMRLASHH